MKHVGENIKRIRTAKKMTISDVANEHVSRGMISLIENGKTQPSIERLHHIAAQLDVDIAELVEEVSKEELREVIKAIQKAGDEETISLVQPLLNKVGQTYEAARIYEFYAKSLYNLYVNSNEKYVAIEENNWELHISKAIAIYGDLQMEWRVIKLWGFLAIIEFLRANYKETIAIIDKGLDKLSIEDSLDTKSTYIELLLTKISALAAMGRKKEAHQLLDETIRYSQDNMIFIDYYPLLNIKTWLYYEEQQFEEARKCVVDAGAFIQMVNKDHLIAEYEGTKILFEEFYEKDYVRTIQLSDDYEQHTMEKISIPHPFKEMYLELSRNIKARALTKLGRYDEALQLFEANQLIMNEFIQMSPLDVAIREISKSYEALCHFHLSNAEKAQELARCTVDKLHNMPYSSYYHFAREVLNEVNRG